MWDAYLLVSDCSNLFCVSKHHNDAMLCHNCFSEMMAYIYRYIELAEMEDEALAILCVLTSGVNGVLADHVN